MTGWYKNCIRKREVTSTSIISGTDWSSPIGKTHSRSDHDSLCYQLHVLIHEYAENTWPEDGRTCAQSP